MNSFKIQGNIVDIKAKNIFYGEVEVAYGKIASIKTLTIPDSKPLALLCPVLSTAMFI